MKKQQNQVESVGQVYLVGAGPGDPELLTVRACRLLNEADVVVYDRLVSPAILEQIPAGVSRIYVGKRDGNHHLSQDEINQLLVKLGRAGYRVVRLKGGDPFVFGRGSEEALHLARHGVPYEVVPGLTAATACAAAADIPLTHREVARSVCFVAGRCAGDLPADVDWSKLADARTTVVLYMGMRQLAELTRALIAAGRDPATPAAVIENGTLPQQRTLVAALGTVSQRVREQDFQAPSVIIIGEVVAIARQLRSRDQWDPPLVQVGAREVLA